jgi:hypothetical protein
LTRAGHLHRKMAQYQLPQNSRSIQRAETSASNPKYLACAGD